MSDVRLLEHWSAPDGAGAPLACLATSFTFDADFFTQDCLSRFLGLSTVSAEGDHISSVAAVLEEEDRLSEAQVTVLVDRSSPAEKRNLRWDLLPVAIPGGLLHAKVAVLLWERHCRIVIGSANLTPAGYRRQVELALALELGDGCQVPRQVCDDLIAELRRIVALAAGPEQTGPKARALRTLGLLADRVNRLDLPLHATGPMRLAVAPSRPGTSPLVRLADVWQGAQPLRATILSPFWDDGRPAASVAAVAQLLTGRPAERRELTLLVGIDPHRGTLQGPAALAEQPRARIASYTPRGDEPRRLHAKLILVESDDWVAAMVGSSNATTPGLGLHPRIGHHELNLWIGCPATGGDAKALRALAGTGTPVELDEQEWETVPDEDEPAGPQLPLGFVDCLIEPGAPARAVLTLDPSSLPATWEIRHPTGRAVLDSTRWHPGAVAAQTGVELPAGPLPAYVLVHWSEGGVPHQAALTANVADRTTLPPPAELAELPVEILLAALASTRPLPHALEQALRGQRDHAAAAALELDPLRRFDGSGLLLQRTRRHSLALWRLQERLGKPATGFDALHWRLHGAFGPVAIADALVAAPEQDTVAGERHFLLAELALTIRAVDWTATAAGLDQARVRELVAEAVEQLRQRRDNLGPAPAPALDAYVRDAMEATR
ncbi:hypothetical protein ACFQO7_34555 [Catellatospora aurea]|uniref:PLD phosphodiesterase domain-containing protein n=1 Tax=Catellatospora aurea TaxID=1337874 RepID=A0ABW2H8E6_9ACTN